MSNQSQYFLTTLDKGLRILNLFSREHITLSQSEISKSIGTNKTSTFRFVETLVQLGYLRKDPKTKLLKLGTKAFSLGYRFLQSFDHLQVIKPFIDKAYDDLKITIDSAILDEENFFILYRYEDKESLTFRLPMMESDLYCNALGKAAMAFLPEDERERFIDHQTLKKRTATTIVTREDLLGDLAITKTRGYSLNNEEYIPGLISIGAPIFAGRSNHVIGAISFDFPTVEHSLASIERGYSKKLTKLAERISAAMPTS